MEYNLKNHGDPIEAEYSGFIKQNFPTYEDVWKAYIGNKGNDIRVSIEGYPQDRENARVRFSEHTYTILQSIVSLDRLINKDIFSKGFMNSINDRLDLHDYLLLFFTHLGRIRDNIQSATACLIGLSDSETTNILDEVYFKRHIVVHGKMIPVYYEPNGQISLPVLSKSSIDASGWYHKLNSWEDIRSLRMESVETTMSKLYWELLPKVTDIFGKFRKAIDKELSDGGYILKFEHVISNIRLGSGNSGSSGYGAVNVYGIDDPF